MSFRYSLTDQALRLKDVVWRNHASFDLRSAKVKTFLNDQSGWPEPNNVFLHGFTYDELDAEARLDARTQIDWVQRQPRLDFIAQPYEQAAAVLRNMGFKRKR